MRLIFPYSCHATSGAHSTNVRAHTYTANPRTLHRRPISINAPMDVRIKTNERAHLPTASLNTNEKKVFFFTRLYFLSGDGPTRHLLVIQWFTPHSCGMSLTLRCLLTSKCFWAEPSSTKRVYAFDPLGKNAWCTLTPNGKEQRCTQLTWCHFQHRAPLSFLPIN